MLKFFGIGEWSREHLEEKTEHNCGKPFESKIVSEDELTAYVDEGWDLVREKSKGKIVIRRPIRGSLDAARQIE